jgi:hypothetical protein
MMLRGSRRAEALDGLLCIVMGALEANCLRGHPFPDLETRFAAMAIESRNCRYTSLEVR